MVQIIQPSPAAMQLAQLGENLGLGLTKRAALSSAEKAFEGAGNNPVKLATAMARLMSASPELARGAGPMYEAMLRNIKGQAIRRGAGEGGGIGQEGQDVQPSTLLRTPQPSQEGGLQPEQFIPKQQQEPIPLTETTPGIQQTGIAAEETLPVPYWSPQQRLSHTSKYLDMGFLPEEAQQQAERDEKAYMANPEQYQKRYEQLEKKRKDAIGELTRQLETKTQKKGEELFKDIPGEYLIGMEKGLERDIRKYPNKTSTQIADDWSTRALNTAKAKDQFNKFAETQGIETLFKGKTPLGKLYNYGKIFEKSGNQEQYFNLLKEKMQLSPQGASSIAFRTRPQINEVIEKNVNQMTPRAYEYDQGKQARKLANLVGENLSGNDSLLGIAWEARKKNSLFDQSAFFDQITRNSDLYNLNPRQERELAEGKSKILPNWGDIKIFEWLGE